MSDQDIIRALVGYHVASSRRLWEHLNEHLTDEQFVQPIDYSHGSIRNQVVHLAATDRYWLHDIQMKPVTGLKPEDYPTRQSFAPIWEEVEAALLDYVQSLAEAGLAQVPGGLLETRWEALVHVVNHGTDHRAQIMSMLHGLGVATFGQDFPDYLRTQRRVSKAQVLELIRFWHAKWKRALESIPEDRMEVPVAGEWSAKDLLAHLTWYEREMVYTLKERKFSIAEWWNLPRDERNRLIYEQQHSQTLEQVLEEHDRVHAALVDEIEQLGDDYLNDTSYIKDMPEDTKLWELLERNTWFHYLQHSEALI